MIRRIALVIPIVACAMLASTVSGLAHAKSVEVVISKEADDLELLRNSSRRTKI